MTQALAAKPHLQILPFPGQSATRSMGETAEAALIRFVFRPPTARTPAVLERLEQILSLELPADTRFTLFYLRLPAGERIAQQDRLRIADCMARYPFSPLQQEYAKRAMERPVSQRGVRLRQRVQDPTDAYAMLNLASPAFRDPVYAKTVEAQIRQLLGEEFQRVPTSWPTLVTRLSQQDCCEYDVELDGAKLLRNMGTLLRSIEQPFGIRLEWCRVQDPDRVLNDPSLKWSRVQGLARLSDLRALARQGRTILQLSSAKLWLGRPTGATHEKALRSLKQRGLPLELTRPKRGGRHKESGRAVLRDLLGQFPTYALNKVVSVPELAKGLPLPASWPSGEEAVIHGACPQGQTVGLSLFQGPRASGMLALGLTRLKRDILLDQLVSSNLALGAQIVHLQVDASPALFRPSHADRATGQASDAALVQVALDGMPTPTARAAAFAQVTAQLRALGEGAESRPKILILEEMAELLAEVDPAGAVLGTWLEAAQQTGVALVLLESGIKSTDVEAQLLRCFRRDRIPLLVLGNCRFETFETILAPERADWERYVLGFHAENAFYGHQAGGGGTFFHLDALSDLDRDLSLNEAG